MNIYQYIFTFATCNYLYKLNDITVVVRNDKMFCLCICTSRQMNCNLPPESCCNVDTRISKTWEFKHLGPVV